MNEEELLKRSAEERERIFSRYERGREDGAEIDPWEDPGFEVYHATDRYGFIHDKRLPSKVDPQEAKRLQVELERQKKWLKMLRQWDSPHIKEKLASRVYKGIPNSLRTQAWGRLLNVEPVKNANIGKYEEMLKLARLYSTDARQIDSDVNRQFREHLHYRERYSIKQRSLFNVLTAYAMFNSEVGYCQGMSGLAGVLLMYMDEEDAFWAVHILLTDPKYAMHGLYKEGFPKLTRYLAHHDRILTKMMPKLKKHFDKHGLDAILYSLKWFFVCFVERVPFSLCLRVWDIYLLDGERVITAMAYNILKLHKRSLLKLADMDSIVNFIQVKLYKDFMLDDDTVITGLEKSMDELRRHKLDYPGPPAKEELPCRPFGYHQHTTFEQMVGRRSEQFTDTERQTNQLVTLTSEQARLSATTDQAGLAGSKFSIGPSMDGDGSSLLEYEGSRRSLADTSITSTADLSVFSAATPRSQHGAPGFAGDSHSLDTHSCLSDGSGGGASSLDGVNHQPVQGYSTGSLQRGVSGQSTPRATPLNPSPDILRIYVPYSPLETPVVSPHNGELPCRMPPSSLPHEGNRIRIRVDTGSDELATPLVEHGRIRSFGPLESPIGSPIDLK